MQDTKLAVVILAAGKSTRFKSKTTKVLHDLCGKPMVEWILDAALPLDPAQIIIVYGTHSTALTEAYSNGYDNREIAFVLQEPTLGTAHALEQARGVLADNVTHLLVLPGDSPLVTAEQLQQLAPVMQRSQVTHAVLTADIDRPGDLGRVLRDPDYPDLTSRIVEAHEASDEELTLKEINTGIYLFERTVFDHLSEAAEKIGASEKKGEYYLPDVVQVAPTLAVKADGFETPIGVNDRAQLNLAEQALLKRLREYWMAQGVTFHLPDTTYLHYNVKLAPDVEVGPHCVLTHGTKVGSGTALIQGCLLETCVVGEDCELRHVRGLMSVIDNNVSAGPYVNMRPGTHIRENCKIGNFVETKNADIGPGSKLPHLQYIGDATLGSECNIGAGTIFCNYDGFSKLHTTLGDGVFIGSNSALQGGITIGDGAYVAMASAITKDIPAGALGIGRARQENKLDYVERLKDRLRKRKEKSGAEKTANGGASGG